MAKPDKKPLEPISPPVSPVPTPEPVPSEPSPEYPIDGE